METTLYRTFLAKAKEGNCVADRVSHQLAHCTVAHTVAPTVTELNTRQIDDDKRVLVVSD
eukprot:5431109-Lingulodinium_polyedra.AAC.1